MADRKDQDIPPHQPHPHQRTPLSPSSPSSHLHQLFKKLFAEMVAQCPAPDMEELMKARMEDDEEKVLDIMNRLFLTSTSGDLHRINAEIRSERAAADTSGKHKPRHLMIGIASATRSVQLCPNDIRNRYVLVSLLSQFARDTRVRKLVIRACEDALLIDEMDDRDDHPGSTRSKFTDLLQQEREIDSSWESMIKKSYIKVPINDLVDHYREDELAIEVLNEAWGYFTERQEKIAAAWKSMTQGRYIPLPCTYLERYNSAKEALDIVREALEIGESLSWMFWQCCPCDEKFHSSGLLFKHVWDTHLTEQAKSTVRSRILESGNACSSSEMLLPSDVLPVPQIQDMMFGDGVSTRLLVFPSCLSLDASAIASPSQHYPIANPSYQPKLDQWKNLRVGRIFYGTKFHQALEKMSAGVIPNPQASEEEQEKALERLITYIDSEIKDNGAWTFPPESETRHLTHRSNFYGAYDYRELLLPLVQSYFAVI